MITYDCRLSSARQKTDSERLRLAVRLSLPSSIHPPDNVCRRGISHMGGSGYDTDELISRIKEYKSMHEGWYGDVGADFVYVLYPYDDYTLRWDQAIEQLLPFDPSDGDESEKWRKNLEPMILETRASQLDEFVYDDGNPGELLYFACDVVDITECQWSMLCAERAQRGD